MGPMNERRKPDPDQAHLHVHPARDRSGGRERDGVVPVATAHVPAETENRLLAVAEAGALVIDPLTRHGPRQPGSCPALSNSPRVILHAMQQRLGVREAYVFDRDRRILATTDTVRMDAGAIAPGLANYANEIERALRGEAVVTAPFSDDQGNVYQSAMVPLVGYVARGPDPGGDRRDPWCGPLARVPRGVPRLPPDDDPPDDDRDPTHRPRRCRFRTHSLQSDRQAGLIRGADGAR